MTTDGTDGRGWLCLSSKKLKETKGAVALIPEPGSEPLTGGNRDN